MDQTPNLSLPYIAPSQAQKHVTHNEAIRALDAIVQIGVLDRDLTAPPGEPDNGSRYLVASGATGDWVEHVGDVAAWQDGAWAFYAPRAGWLAWVEDEGKLVAFDGEEWVVASEGGGGSSGGDGEFDTLGVNATADSTNRLVVASEASLFDHDGNGHQHKINKASASDTAAMLFQTNYSGRAEFGLAGDDDFHVKVSADGSDWKEAIVIHRATGVVTLPLTPRREVLGANRTYFVRTDGNDSNDGLANTSGGAFLTVQKAVNVALALDMSIYEVTINVGAGTFAANLEVIGNGNARIKIIGAGRASTTLGSGSGNAIQATYGVRVTVQGLTLANASVGLWARFGAVILIGGDVQFSGSSARLIGVDNGGYIESTSGSIYLSANAPLFLYAEAFGQILIGSGVTIYTTQAITLSGNVVHSRQGRITLGGSLTWNESAGSITGKRYLSDQNGVVASNGGTIPGTVSGSVATGGQYI